MAFTEADRRKLEALKEKERQAKKDARNEQKRADRMCEKLFGMTAKQVQEKLSDDNDRWSIFDAQAQLVGRLMAAMGRRPEDFQRYVEACEKKAVGKAG